MAKPTAEEGARGEELAAWLQKLDEAHQLCTCRTDCVECRECDKDYPCDIKKLLDVLEKVSLLNMKLIEQLKLARLLLGIKSLI